jgi:hypothetical protein
MELSGFPETIVVLNKITLITTLLEWLLFKNRRPHFKARLNPKKFIYFTILRKKRKKKIKK